MSSESFDKALSSLVTLFGERDPATAIWCLKYLVTHFPTSSSVKQPLFFRQVENLLPVLPKSAIGIMATQIVNILSKCLATPTIAVLFPALFFASNPGFAGLVQQSDERSKRLLSAALKSACGHWKQEAAEMAQKIVSGLRMRDLPSPMSEKKDQWAVVKDMAIGVYGKNDACLINA